MKSTQKIILPLLAFLMLSCASTKKGYDFDQSVDFSTFNTYAFSKETMNVGIMTLNKQKIIKAIENEMQKKGFEKSDHPDVLIDMIFSSKKVVNASKTTTNGNPWRYAYWSGASASDTYYNKYDVGNIVVSMVDKGTKQMVWFSSCTKALPDGASVSKTNSTINQAVRNIFKKYPSSK